ncbi:hypothetical protein FO519_007381 [Halicephalobus sp. NKZ332]|nr:hypothetical protein FO519_007381 [Halicephalobus sp. NKZ332]
MEKQKKFKVIVTDKSLAFPKVNEIAHTYYNESQETMNREELLREVSDADGIICLLRDRIDKELLEHAKKLKVVSTVSVGFEHVDIRACGDRGVKVSNTPDVLTDTTAELGCTLVLCASRGIRNAMKIANSGVFPSWSPYLHCTSGVKDMIIGIYGLGRIGTGIADRLSPFKPKEIIYHNRRKVGNSPLRYVSFEELNTTSDIIVICVDASTCPAKTFNFEFFKKMKKTALIVNIARGSLVDHDDLAEALAQKEIGGAALDVTNPEPLPREHRLHSFENCLITPHIGSATFNTREAMVNLAENNLCNGLLGTGDFIGPVP